MFKAFTRWAFPWLVAACMHNPTAVYAQGSLPASTGCIGDTIVTLYQPDVAEGTLARGELDAHEAIHRAQIDSIMRAAHVSCFVALASLTINYEANFRFEVPAYRAQGDWNAAHRPGFDRRAYDLKVARALLFYYESKIPIGTIFSAVNGSTREPWAEEGIDLTPGTTTHAAPSPLWALSDPLTCRLVRRGMVRV